MKLNLKRPLVIFDLETTGLDIVKDRIIQIAYIKVHPDGKEERKSHFVNPGMPIPKEVTEITHITNNTYTGDKYNDTKRGSNNRRRLNR